MTADLEAVTRVLLAHDGEVEDDGQRIRCTGVGCGFRSETVGSARTQFAAHLASVLASLPDDRFAEAEKDANGPGWFWTRTEWSEWSNELALLIPEEYDDDVAQEAIISRAVADMVKRLAEAEAAVRRVEALCDQADADAGYVFDGAHNYGAKVETPRILAALSGGGAT